MAAIGSASTREMRVRALEATGEVLTVQESGTGIPAVFRYLVHRPGDRAIVAQLWAAVARYRQLRRDAFDALLDGLDRLAEVTAEPENVARELGEALSGAVPANETPAFHRDLQVRLMWRRRRSKASEAGASHEPGLDRLIRILSAPLGAPADIERKN